MYDSQQARMESLPNDTVKFATFIICLQNIVMTVKLLQLHPRRVTCALSPVTSAQYTTSLKTAHDRQLAAILGPIASLSVSRVTGYVIAKVCGPTADRCPQCGNRVGARTRVAPEANIIGHHDSRRNACSLILFFESFTSAQYISPSF